METLNTVIEFVSSGTGGGAGDTAAAATGSSATADPLFSICAILAAFVAIGVSLFLYARHNKIAAASAMATHARPSVGSNKTTQAKGSKLLIAAISIIIAATCFAVCGHNNALAEENSTGSDSIATISDKVQANVDDNGTVTFDKGIITNNSEVLAIGVRQVESESTIDLSDAKLTINCDDTVLYDDNLGSTHTNNSYCDVALGSNKDLTYTISINAEKAKSLVGQAPITINTKVDLICQPTGKIVDDDSNPISGAKISYSYTDPYTGEVITKSDLETSDNGTYTIPFVKEGTNLQLIAEKDGKSTEYSYTAEEKEEIATQVISSFAIAPTAIEGLTYNGTEQTGITGGSNVVITGDTKGTDADTYTATATPKAGTTWKGEGGSEPKDISWSIAQKALTEDMVKVGAIPTYSGELQTLEITAEDGTIMATTDYDVTGNTATEVQTTPQTWIVTAKNNYTGTVTGTWTLKKADQAAPTGLAKTDPTLKDKADGTITGVSDSMEYRSGEGEWTDVPATQKISNLAAGTYQVRIKGDNNHNPSIAVEFVLNEGSKTTLTYNLNEGEGTAPKDEKQYSYNEKATVLGKTESMKKGELEFKSWNTQADGSGEKYIVGDEFTVEAAGPILYAQWGPAVPASISGIVYNAASTPAPLAGATVECYKGEESITTVSTSTDGSYTISGIEYNVEYTLKVTKGLLDEMTETVTVTSGPITGKDITMTKSGGYTLSFSVVEGLLEREKWSDSTPIKNVISYSGYSYEEDFAYVSYAYIDDDGDTETYANAFNGTSALSHFPRIKIGDTELQRQTEVVLTSDTTMVGYII